MNLLKAYEVVQALQMYSDAPREDKDKAKNVTCISASVEDAREKLKAIETTEKGSLYCIGSVKVPRSLLYYPAIKGLSRAAKSVFIWLMTKQQVLQNAAAAGVENEETARLPIVTARNIEIAKYAGVAVKGISKQIKELESAGLIKMKKVKKGGKIIGTLYQLPTWPADSAGYIDIPIKTMLTPAWVCLDHNAKWIWIVLLSERNVKKDGGEMFPRYDMAYSQMKKTGINSDRTIRHMTVELEALGFVNIKHGKLVQDKDTKLWAREINQYQISADHLHMYKHTVDAIKAGLKKMWAHETKEKPATEQPAAAVA